MEEIILTEEDLRRELQELDKRSAKELREKFRRHYDGFWEFQKYMDDSKRSGYTDEQMDVKLVAFALYLLIWGYVHKMVLSMPRRRRKSHAVNDAVKYVIGFMPERSNARYSHSENLVKKHSRMIKSEIQSVKYLDVFPNIELKSDARNVLEWEVKQCMGEPTFHCAGIGGTATGYGVDCLLIGDDLVAGWRAAHSQAEKSNLSSFLAGNFESSEEEGMKELHIATRWADDDPPGIFLLDAGKSKNRIFKFDAYYTKLTQENIDKFIQSVLDAEPTEYDVLHITIPALDKDDETTCPYNAKYTTEYYRNKRDKYFKKGQHHIWYSIYQQTPRLQGSMLFADFKNWYYIEDMKKINFSGGVAHIDPAGKGSNNTCLGIAKIFGNKVYIMPDIVYTAEAPKTSKKECVEYLKKRYQSINIITGEANGGGDQYCESLSEKLSEANIPIEFNDSNIIGTDQNKELKIFLNSDWILNNVYLPAELDKDGKRQYEIDSPIDRCIKALTKYIGKVEGQYVRNQEDDFLDFLCGIKDIVAEDNDEFEVDYY